MIEKVGWKMKHICILCDHAYEPNRQQQKKLMKFPQLIQICPRMFRPNHKKSNGKSRNREKTHSND